LLAVDSAFSIIESVIRVFHDRYPNTSVQKISFVVSVLGFLAGLIFTTGAGLYVLDIVDHFILNYAMVLIGLLEAVAVGWFWKDELAEYLKKNSDWKVIPAWNFSIKFLVPIVLTILLIWNILEEIKAPYGAGEYPDWALIWFGGVPIVATLVIGYILDWLTDKKA
jgi:NSS family neurotransmitter:Na+ symporter